MKKMNKFALIVGTMLILVSCIIPAASAIALSEGTDGEPVAVVADGSTEREGILEIEGEVGDTFSVGNLIFEIVSDEEMDRVLSEPQTRASTKRWEISLSGDSLSKDFSQRIIRMRRFGSEMIWTKNMKLCSPSHRVQKRERL